MLPHCFICIHENDIKQMLIYFSTTFDHFYAINICRRSPAVTDGENRRHKLYNFLIRKKKRNNAPNRLTHKERVSAISFPESALTFV